MLVYNGLLCHLSWKFSYDIGNMKSVIRRFLANKVFSIINKHLKLINHHVAEIPAIWLVKWSTMKFLILFVTKDKQTLRSKEISMVTLHCQHFGDWFLVFVFWRRKKKGPQWSHDNSLKSFIAALFKRDVFRSYPCN